MTRHYVTLFDHRYLPQGIALYESLKQHETEEFYLMVLPLDEECWRALESIDLPGLGKIHPQLWEEYKANSAMKASRSYAEYCWSCASTFTEFMMESCGGDWTYLDADLFFFSNPSPVFAQIGERSIAITPHRFPDNPQKTRLEKSGKFNVGFVHLKNTEVGRKCLSKWASQVRERCSAEVGCGDQLYLDAWPEEYGNEVAMLGHGVNTGPWNLSGYEVCMYDGQVFLDRHPLINFHFHEWRENEDGSIRRTNYELRQRDIELIYDPYQKAVASAKERIAAVFCSNAAESVRG